MILVLFLSGSFKGMRCFPFVENNSVKNHATVLYSHKNRSEIENALILSVICVDDRKAIKI